MTKGYTDHFLLPLLGLMSEYELYQFVRWDFDSDQHPVRFFVPCDDLFAAYDSDAVEITPSNLGVFRQSLKEATEIDENSGLAFGCDLFCCRDRQSRPRKAAYPGHPQLIDLFDAAGPLR